MTDRSSLIPPPIEAGPARKVLHGLITLVGWLVFLYWWWLVFQRVSRQEVRFTALFIAISLAIIVLATLIWAWHNLRISRRRGPRKHNRETQPDFSHDGVGRNVLYPLGGVDLKTAPVVRVRFVESGKRYEFVRNVPLNSDDPTPESPQRGASRD